MKETMISREDLEAGKIDLGEESSGPRQAPVHPGEHLAEFMADHCISARGLAQALAVPPNRVTAILRGQRSITGETALRLARCFGTSAAMWLRLQARYEEDMARATIGARVEAEVRRLAEV